MFILKKELQSIIADMWRNQDIDKWLIAQLAAIIPAREFPAPEMIKDNSVKFSTMFRKMLKKHKIEIYRVGIAPITGNLFDTQFIIFCRKKMLATKIW